MEPAGTGFPGLPFAKREIEGIADLFPAVNRRILTGATATEATLRSLDLERFRWFSSGYVALDPKAPNRVIDVRYSLVPNRIDALWGIELDSNRTLQAHAVFFSERSPSPEDRTALRRMLQGAPVAR